MKTISLRFALALFISFVSGTALYAQTALPYYTGFDDPTQQSGWQEVRMGNLSMENWTTDTGGYLASYMLFHDYPVGNSNTDTVMDWYISPPFDFSHGARIDSLKLRLFSMNDSANADDQLQIYLLQDAPHPEAAIALLADLTAMASNSGAWLDTGNFVIPPTAGTCYIAFKYRATNDWFVSSIDNIYISSNAAAAVTTAKAGAGEITLHPNPASTSISINFPDATLRTLVLTDVFGSSISKRSLSKANMSLDISTLAAGAYYITVLESGRLVKTISWIKN